MKIKFDIAIIGAGPSGCAAALALHDSGLRVVLIDKSTFPRDKICGDAIPGPAFKAMELINPKWAEEMRSFADSYSINSSQVFGLNTKSIKLNWVTFAYNSKRIDFDHFLFQLVQKNTNTTIYENKRLQDIYYNEEAVICQFQDESSIEASLIIAADGVNSIVKRKLAIPKKEEHVVCAAVRAYYKNVDGIQSGVNEFHFFKELLPGYFWIFPLENGWVNIGFGILQKKIGKHKKNINLRQALETIITEMPSIAPRFKHAEMMLDIKSFGLPLAITLDTISGKGYMLCGDAASLIDPLQGHGIHHAIYSGYYAAQQAKKCFKEKRFDADFMKQYDITLYQKIGSELKRNSFLLRLFSKAPFMIDWIMLFNQKQIDFLAKWFKI